MQTDYEDLINRGVFLQINWLSIIGYYSPQIKKKTEELISKEMVSFIGSDCHNMNHAKLYSKCQSKRSWHQLLESGKLLNHKL